MALLDPADQHKIHRSGDHAPTTKPRLCLVGFVAFLVTTALAVHFALQGVQALL